MSNIEIIMRQTNYSKEEAEEKLKKHNNDVMKTIEEYINYDSSQNENVKTTTNQQIYKEIRELLSHQNSSLSKK